jgi:phenylpyruvate tautomerase PptA (4-oxalocrotonate tautomerase family)
MVGEYSSYPVQGSTLLGASAFTVPQTVDLNGNSATLLEVAKLQTQGATQIAGDVKAETMVMAKDVPPGEWFRADVKLRDLPMTVMIQKM